MSRSKGPIHQAQKSLNRLQNASKRGDRRKKANARRNKSRPDSYRRSHKDVYDRYALTLERDTEEATEEMEKARQSA